MEAELDSEKIEARMADARFRYMEMLASIQKQSALRVEGVSGENNRRQLRPETQYDRKTIRREPSKNTGTPAGKDKV